MKLITAYTVAAALLCQTASTLNTNCHPGGAKVSDIAGLFDRPDSPLSTFKDKYRISGLLTNTFATNGSAKMTMRRIFKPLFTLPGGSTHTTVPDVIEGIEEILFCCNEFHYDPCEGDSDLYGDQGDTVNINIT